MNVNSVSIPELPISWQIACLVALVVLLLIVIAVWSRQRGKGKSVSVTPLDYNTVLTLDEAKARLAEVEAVFESVKAKYPGGKGSIAKEDNTLLANCVGVLLPLSSQRSVQEEFTRMGPQDSTWAKCSALQQEIMLFVAGFDNSGVKVYWTNEPFDF